MHVVRLGEKSLTLFVTSPNSPNHLQMDNPLRRDEKHCPGPDPAPERGAWKGMHQTMHQTLYITVTEPAYYCPHQSVVDRGTLEINKTKCRDSKCPRS